MIGLFLAEDKGSKEACLVPRGREKKAEEEKELHWPCSSWPHAASSVLPQNSCKKFEIVERQIFISGLVVSLVYAVRTRNKFSRMEIVPMSSSSTTRSSSSSRGNGDGSEGQNRPQELPDLNRRTVNEYYGEDEARVQER